MKREGGTFGCMFWVPRRGLEKEQCMDTRDVIFCSTYPLFAAEKRIAEQG